MKVCAAAVLRFDVHLLGGDLASALKDAALSIIAWRVIFKGTPEKWTWEIAGEKCPLRRVICFAELLNN